MEHYNGLLIELVVSYIEIPIDCPEDQENPSRNKTYEIQSGITQIKAHLQDKILLIKVENKSHSSKGKIIEKIVIFNKIFYREQMKSVSYILKWICILLAFNLLYWVRKYKMFSYGCYKDRFFEGIRIRSI